MAAVCKLLSFAAANVALIILEFIDLCCGYMLTRLESVVLMGYN